MAAKLLSRVASRHLSQCSGALFGSSGCTWDSPVLERAGLRACSSSPGGLDSPSRDSSAGQSTEVPSTDAATQQEEQQLKLRFEDPDGFDDDFFPVQLLREPYGMLGNKRVTRAEKLAAKQAMKGVDRRLQYHHIPVPPNVTVQALGTRLFFTGPLGSNAIDLEKIDDQGLSAFKLQRADDGRITGIDLAGPSKSITGTARTLLHNKINGVARGYLVYLQLSGVGFRVSKENKDVTFPVGH